MGFGVCFSVNTFFPFYFNFYLHFVNFFFYLSLETYPAILEIWNRFFLFFLFILSQMECVGDEDGRKDKDFIFSSFIS